MEIYLNNGHAFPVPVAVADHLLGLASHDQLKVLLYVLCHAGESLPQEQIAACCKVQPSAVEEAIVFWQDANVLQTAPPAASVRLQQNTQPQPAPAAETPETASVEPARPPVRKRRERETVFGVGKELTDAATIEFPSRIQILDVKKPKAKKNKTKGNKKPTKKGEVK